MRARKIKKDPHKNNLSRTKLIGAAQLKKSRTKLKTRPHKNKKPHKINWSRTKIKRMKMKIEWNDIEYLNLLKVMSSLFIKLDPVNQRTNFHNQFNPLLLGFILLQ